MINEILVIVIIFGGIIVIEFYKWFKKRKRGR
jgi:hypothetical protein